MIDSWEDLHFNDQWNHLIIQTIDFTDMDVFAHSSDTEMAKDFRQRLHILENVDLFIKPNKSLIKQLNERVIRGEAVQVFNNEIMQKWKNYYLEKGYVEDIDFHVSKLGHSTVYFAQTHLTMPQHYVSALDNM